MGIWAILSGDFGEMQGKILFTTLSVVGTSILGLACGAFLESPRVTSLKIVPQIGIAVAVLCAFSAFWLIWGNSGSGGEFAFKFFIVLLICAFSLAQLSLLSMARLADRFRWSLAAAYVIVFALDLIICPIIVFELSGDDGLILRLIGILSVVAASLTVMIPIFHWFSRSEYIFDERSSMAKIDEQIADLSNQLARLEKQRAEMNNVQDAYQASED